MGMLPGSILMIAAMFVGSVTVEWSLSIIGVILMIIIPLIFTPLHKEEWADLVSQDNVTRLFGVFITIGECLYELAQ